MPLTPDGMFTLLEGPPDALVEPLQDFQHEVETAIAAITPGGAPGLLDPGGNGLVVRTSLSTTVARSMVQPAAGLQITNPDGVAGGPTFALTNDLSALEALGSTGYARRTGSDTWTTDTTIPATAGGTGQTSYAVGDLIYASTTTALSRLAGVATGNVLLSGGVSTAPAWGKVGLTTHVSGTLAEGSGGTNQTTYVLGDLLYSNSTNTLARLPGNTTTSRKFLRQVGNGSVSAAPAWDTIQAGDLPGSFAGFANPSASVGLSVVNGSSSTAMRSDAAPALDVSIIPTWSGAHTFTAAVTLGTSGLLGALKFTGNTSGLITMQSAAAAGTWTFTLPTTGGTATYALTTNGSGVSTWTQINLTSAVTGTLPVINGGTGATTLTANGVLYGNGTSAVQMTVQGVANSVLTANVGAPVFSAAPVIGTSITVPTLLASADLTFAPSSNAIFNTAGKHIDPLTNYDQNLGQLSKKYLTLHAAELWVETLVAQSTIATIGGRILVGTTNILIADLGTGGTTIDVKYNNFLNGDRIYFEANGAVEFMAIASTASTITGGYRYSVTRDLDGTGANQWYAGDAAFDTGSPGSGFIDLYSVRGVKSSSQVGPTIVGNVRNSYTFNDWSERWAIGNLNGLYGYGADTYGVAFGVPTAAWVKIDPTNGVRIGHNATTYTQIDASGNASFTGSVTAAAGTIAGWTIDSAKLSSSTTYIASAFDRPAAASAWFGKESSTSLTGWQIRDAGGKFIQALANLGSNYPYFSVYDGSFTRVVVGGLNFAFGSDGATASMGMKIWSSAGTKLVEFSDTQNIIAGWTIAASRLSSANVFIDQAGQYVSMGASPPTSYGSNVGVFIEGANSGRLSLYKDANNYLQWDSSKLLIKAANFTLDSSGNLTASSATLSGAVTATSGSITGTLSISGSTGAIAIGSTPPSDSSTGTGIWIDRTGFYALGTNNRNTTIDAATGVSYFGTAIYLKVPTSGGTQMSVYFAVQSGAFPNVGELRSKYLGSTADHEFSIISTGVTSGNPKAYLLLKTINYLSTHDTLLDFYSDNSTSYARLYSNNGTFGGLMIGSTSTPAAQLHTTGTVRFANFGAGTATFDASGNLSSSSDERLKLVKGPYTRGLAAIRKIRPVLYSWRPHSGMETGETYPGFTTQDVGRSDVLPEAVFHNSAGIGSLWDRGITAALVNSVRELDDNVDSLRRTILALAAEVARLRLGNTAAN